MRSPLLGLFTRLLLGATLASCSGSAAAPVLSPTEDQALCILGAVAVDLTKNLPWEQAVADAISQCSSPSSTPTAADVARVWASHQHAEVLEGVVPKPIAGYDAGSL